MQTADICAWEYFLRQRASILLFLLLIPLFKHLSGSCYISVKCIYTLINVFFFFTISFKMFMFGKVQIVKLLSSFLLL